jgi:hypothetical protein
MNAVFFKSTGRFLEKLSLLTCLFLLPLMVMGADATWNSADHGAFFHNPPPQIDATTFINSGTWNIGTLSPFETAHTLNYTNKSGGSMTGTVGWEFDWGPAVSGPRRWSANFFNDNQATITAVDFPLPNPFSYPILTPVSYLLVSATNIVNKGLLAAGAAGEIILTGSNVNLTHSQMEISPVVPVGSFNTANNGTNYSPDVGIYDLYWGTNNNLIINGSITSGGDVGDFTYFNISQLCGVATNTIQIPRENELLKLLNPTNPPVFLHPTVSDSVSTNTGLLLVTATNYTGVPPFTAHYTQYFLATNQFRQAVFVRVATNVINGQIRFEPTGNTTNLFETAAVQLSTVITNVITGNPETNYLYVVDTLAVGKRLALLPNLNINPAADCSGATFRPTNFIVSRVDPGAFGAGFPGLGKPLDSFFYDLSFSNAISSGGFVAAYSALVDNLEAEVPAGFSVTNLPGRVRIYANNLNLNQTHVRAEGQILIKATNLTSSVNAIMDCQNLSYDLGTTTSSLNFTNLALPLVRRLQGPIDMWSGFWTNYITVSIDNFVVVTNVTPTSTNITINPAPLTNVLQINLAVFVVDAAGLTNTIPVTVQDLLLHNRTNIVISDSVNVQQSFLLDGPAVTLRGNVNLSGAVQNWTYANAPTLRYFTNNGVLSIHNNAHFGDDGPANYLAFVNRGSIFAGGQTINSVYLQIANGFNQSSSGGFYAVAQTAQLTNANIRTSADIQFFANTLGITNSTLSAGAALDFTVTNSLSDGGAGLFNLFTCQNGFNMWIPPATGRLLNTVINDVVLGQDVVDHYWAGQDFGTNTVSANNAVIGELVLSPSGSQAPGYEPLFAFYGATGGNAMYVNILDLSELTDFANEIYIDPSLTIYFGTAYLNSSINTNGYPGGASGYLNDNSPFRWVSGGFTSSVIPPRESAYTRKFQLTANYDAAARQFQLMENIMPGQTNVLQVSTDLVHWVPLFTNIGSYSNFGPATITDPVSQSYGSRFYRFRILP